MKKILVFAVASTLMLLQFCKPGNKMAKTLEKVEIVKLTYTANVAPLMTLHCTPCHFPPKGNKKPYDTYVGVKGDIDEIITRVKLNPTDRGFMPMRHAKLSDSTINVLVQWKADGLLEK